MLTNQIPRITKCGEGCQGAVASGVFLNEVSLALVGVGSLALLSLYKYEFWKRKPRLYEEWNFYCAFAGARVDRGSITSLFSAQID